MKIIKRITLLTLAALSVLCVALFAAACNNSTAATEFTINVYYSDGTTAVDGTQTGYEIQLCDASGMFCYPDFAQIDANGQAKFTIADVDAAADSANVTDKAYVVHVWARGALDETELKERVTVSSENHTVSVVLKDVAAPQN